MLKLDFEVDDEVVLNVAAVVAVQVDIWLGLVEVVDIIGVLEEIWVLIDVEVDVIGVIEVFVDDAELITDETGAGVDVDTYEDAGVEGVVIVHKLRLKVGR